MFFLKKFSGFGKSQTWKKITVASMGSSWVYLLSVLVFEVLHVFFKKFSGQV